MPVLLDTHGIFDQKLTPFLSMTLLDLVMVD